MTKDKQEEFDIFLENICPTLKLRIQEYMFTVTVTKNRVMRQLLTHQKKFSSHQKTRTVTLILKDIFLQQKEAIIAQEDPFVRSIISKLETCLAAPEEEIIKQNEHGTEMYFIQQGDFVVNLVDHKR